MDTIRTYKLFRPPESYSSSWLVTWDCVYNLVVGHSQATLSDSKVTTSICKATRTKPHGAYGEFLSADDIALQGKIRLLTNCPLAVITALRSFLLTAFLLQCSQYIPSWKSWILSKLLCAFHLLTSAAPIQDISSEVKPILPPTQCWPIRGICALLVVSVDTLIYLWLLVRKFGPCKKAEVLWRLAHKNQGQN